MIKFVVFILGLAPTFYMIFTLFFSDNFPADPFEFVIKITGVAMVAFLLLVLFAKSLTKFIPKILRYRRMFGLFVTFYAILHLIDFLILSIGLDLDELISQLKDNQFILFGMVAFVIFIFMSITSTKKLFRKFKKWHKLIYIAVILSALHYYMSQKSLNMMDIFLIAMLLAGVIIRNNPLKFFNIAR